MKEKTEKERKFLLKKLPSGVNYKNTLFITQYYKEGYRYRSTTSITNPSPIYEKIKKVKIAKGHNKELEIETISNFVFFSNREGTREDRHEISKKRYEIEFGSKIFEVDVFNDLNLIMLEIEDVESDEVINFPPEIEKVLLLEVTGNEKFDNYNLAV